MNVTIKMADYIPDENSIKMLKKFGVEKGNNTISFNAFRYEDLENETKDKVRKYTIKYACDMGYGDELQSEEDIIAEVKGRFYFADGELMDADLAEFVEEQYVEEK